MRAKITKQDNVKIMILEIMTVMRYINIFDSETTSMIG